MAVKEFPVAACEYQDVPYYYQKKIDLDAVVDTAVCVSDSVKSV